MESLFSSQRVTYGMGALPQWPTETLDVSGGELPVFTDLNIDGNGLIEPNHLLSIDPSCGSSFSGLGMDGNWFVESIAEPESDPIISQEPATKKRKRDADSEDREIRAGFLLSEELKAPGEYRYNGLVHDEHHFQGINDAYLRHARQRAGLAAEDDPTWPESDERKRQYVKDLFDAITNTADFHEARKAKAKVEAHKANARGKAPSASERALADDNKTAVDRLEAVLHYKMSNLEVELVSWKVSEAAMACQQGHTMRALWAGERTNSQWDVFETFEARWRAICENMKDCKMMLHSVTRADWVAKLARAPMKERKNKLDNDIINARKGAQLKADAKKMLENGP
ncbi:hypothetical protein CPLU01_15347 [Colletotrichum plurivorum]|uniref:Uncharacterized protein n=1 Tax=Colletotrichum plurivorum TaxID=2175906 RepID=A0A8H6JBX9_9PEZI|nr:hypothetical protein CPLU01_15347 [Colletotrichum plurivorum]